MAKLIKKIDDNYEMTEDDYKNAFLLRRASVSKKTYGKGSIEIEDIYAEAYIDQCALAAGGDVVAQDLLGYWFKHGNPALPENVELSYKWQFLAAAGGNKHTINKLALFLDYSYDTISMQDYFKDLVDVIGLDESNYQSLLGQVICQYIVEDLNINALDLSKEKTVEIKFNQLSMQRFTMSLNRAMVKVHEYFRNLLAKRKNS